MEFANRVKKVLEAHKNGAQEDLIADLLPILNDFVQRQVQVQIALPRVPVRDLEDLLTVVRELKDDYDSRAEKTGQMMIRIDELKQLEYKLSELILSNRH